MGLTKLCPHIIAWNSDVLDFIGRTKPAVIKVIGPFGHNTEYLKEAKRRSPDSKWLFRLYLNEQPLDNPLWNAQKFIEKLNPYLDSYDIFEDYNEIDPRDHSTDPPGPLDIGIIKRYNLFSANIGSRLHAVRKQHITGCWSNGQPPDGAWQHLKESLGIADYLSIHNYGWETLPDCPQFALRHRRVFDLLPVKKLMILSEGGMTNAVFGGPDLGWRSWKTSPNLSAQEGKAAAVWAWFLDRVNEDPYVVAANAYTTGRLQGDNWGTHDFTPRLYKLVGDYILGHPSPDPYLPKREEPKMKNPIKVGIRQDYRIWNSPIIRVETMEMEEYLRRCVPYEVYASWKPETLKAQAVAARTFATWMKAHGKHVECHICNSACCQVMGPSTDPRTDKAVRETEGLFITTRQGEPIKAEYFSFCGGRTEDGGLPCQKSVSCQCWKIAPEDTVKAKHNRGMCQWGAEEMARRGKIYQEILNHYYSLEEPAPDYEALYKDLRTRANGVIAPIQEIKNQLENIEKFLK